MVFYFSEPGSEDYLVQNSLWPETMKLYGHGYEVFSLASTHSGKIVASACKATTAEHAKILLWNTEKWEKVQELEGHQLTITQMAFAPDDSQLLSVSRDRRWCLYRKNGSIYIFSTFNQHYCLQFSVCPSVNRTTPIALIFKILCFCKCSCSNQFWIF